MDTSRRTFIKSAAVLGGLCLTGCISMPTAKSAQNDGNILIKNANLFEREGAFDIAVKDGKIAEIGKNIQYKAPVIDAAGCFVSPGFVDSHMHLDKAYTLGEGEDLKSAIRLSADYFKNIPPDRLAEDIYRRSRALADKALANGTTTIKTHLVTYGRKDLLLASIEATVQLAKDYRDRIEILNVTPWMAAAEKELTDAVKNGDINFLSANAQPEAKGSYEKRVYELFRAAADFNLPIDMHLDESDIPDVGALNLVLDETIRYKMGGRVTGGHITTISAQGMDETEAAKAIQKAKDAGINVITLPSSNLFLMGRSDKKPIRRGITRVHEFLEAGVNVAYASDNVRDHFRPFGNADMLEEGLLTAQVMQYGSQKELRTIYKMGTYNAAANCLLPNYGLNEGCYADLVILDAPSAEEAILSQSLKLYALKRGKIMAQNGKLIV